MSDFGFLASWGPSLSRADVLRRAAPRSDSSLTRIVVGVAMTIAPILTAGTVCAGFLLLSRLG
jgi:hypothetical protein